MNSPLHRLRRERAVRIDAGRIALAAALVVGAAYAAIVVLRARGAAECPQS